ncbi:MAG: sulfatase-like hydrolase/transferase [Rubrivivax sp.]|nr:sulfatase-like hydrolase/transferase [Rubrivivax sp.]
MISIDTLRADYLGCYGFSWNTSPHIDGLAKGSVLFKNAIAQSPWTLPSHMSIFTSLYPAVHLARTKENCVLPEGKVTLVQRLKQEGYYTAAFVDDGWLSHKYGYSRGFDLYDDQGGRIARINRKAIEFLDNHFQEQFFLFIHVYDMHGAYEPPIPYREKFYKGNKNDVNNHSMDFVKAIGYHKYQKFNGVTDINYVKALYAGALRYVDDQLGILFTKLKELNIYDDTLIIFLSDHGESLFDHHIYIGHGVFLYDDEMRIPLIIKWPRSKHPNRVVHRQVESIDVMPTILDLLELSESKEVQGKSLARYITDKEVNKDYQNFGYGESSNTGGTSFVRNNRWKFISHMKINLDRLIEGLEPSGPINLHKYIIDGEQLYDLKRDPLEQDNIIRREPGIARELRTELMRWEEKNKEIALRMMRDMKDASPERRKPILTEEEREKLKALGYIK